MNNLFKIILLLIFPIFCYSLTHAEMESPRQLTDYKWKSAPKIPEVNNQEIGCQDRKIFAAVFVNQTGTVERVKIIKGSGNTEVDQKITQALKDGTFDPYIVNGKAKPFVGLQEIKLKYEESLFKKIFRFKGCY
ncbi:energy transducer TonB [Acinetobacter seifertii]|uniref:energy transducer TonB n=1 Tax=Acinetobacter seifertii TaxID=1530123 RepID=UPI003EE2B954